MVKTIANYVDDMEIDMIVMGSSGADGLKELVLGSNTQKVVRLAHCPVLVVKHPVEELKLKNIVFVSDFKENAVQPFEKLLGFAKPFNSHIHLVNITAYPKFDVSEEDITRMKKFEKMCWMLPCTLHTYRDLDLELGLLTLLRRTKLI